MMLIKNKVDTSTKVQVLKHQLPPGSLLSFLYPYSWSIISIVDKVRVTRLW